LSKNIEVTSESLVVATDLPFGAYLEDFVPGYKKGLVEEVPSENFNSTIQDLQKQLEKNAIFDLGKFGSFLHTIKLYRKMKEKINRPNKFEMYIQRLRPFSKKVEDWEAGQYF
jgi:hypothetical protein